MHFAPALAIAWVLVVFIAGLSAAVLIAIYKGTISLSGIITEPADGTNPGKASLSRLQFLIFTFVISGLYLVLSLESGAFLEIPTEALGLLGISGGSYLVSKGIQSA